MDIFIDSLALCWTSYVQIKHITNKTKLYFLIFLIPQTKKTGMKRMPGLTNIRAGKWVNQD